MIKTNLDRTSFAVYLQQFFPKSGTKSDTKSHHQINNSRNKYTKSKSEVFLKFKPMFSHSQSSDTTLQPENISVLLEKYSRGSGRNLITHQLHGNVSL